MKLATSCLMMGSQANNNIITLGGITMNTMDITTMSITLPIDAEIKVSTHIMEAIESAMCAGAEFDYELQRKWERILAFLDNIG